MIKQKLTLAEVCGMVYRPIDDLHAKLIELGVEDMEAANIANEIRLQIIALLRKRQIAEDA